MTQLITTLNTYLQRPLSELFVGAYMKLVSFFDAFMESKVIKAWEAAARKRVLNYEAQQTIRELSRLSDKELNDIGIARSQIHEIAYNVSQYR